MLEPGRVVDPAAIAVLAATGQARVSVGRRPAVAVLVTGDEIVDVADAPGPVADPQQQRPGARRRRRGSRAPSVRARWASPPTDRERRWRRCATGFDGADVLWCRAASRPATTTSSSPRSPSCGATFFFTGVAIKPGAPLVFGRRGDALVFGLPGNPVSAQVTFELFARAALLQAAGRARHVAAHASRWSSLGLPEPLGPRLPPAGTRALRGRAARGPRAALDGLGRPGGARARQRARGARGRSRSEAAPGETAEAMLLGRFLERRRCGGRGRRVSAAPRARKLSHLDRRGRGADGGRLAQAGDRPRGRGAGTDQDRARGDAARARRAAREGRRRRGGAARGHPRRQAHRRRDPALPPAAARPRGRGARAAARRLPDRGARPHRGAHGRRDGGAPRRRRRGAHASTTW